MAKQLIECVPNFSEGNDMAIIKNITDEITKIEGVKLLDVDPGKATNRTVVTFVGTPDEVIEAAFQAIKKAQELIDMTKHQGAHPRFGATDVCPLVPIANITMEETVTFAHKLSKRVGEELNIPVYNYEFAAREEKRKNLANCRQGEYEGLADKINTTDWKPDFGPSEFTASVAKSGVTAIGARNFLIAYNINLNTTSTRRANAIAFDLRERGRVKRQDGKLTGKPIKDENGETVYISGLLKSVKAIGWYIEEYGVCQISMNLTDITITSMHEAFDKTCERATARGLRVTGSELVGIVPLQAMLDAGKFFLKKQNRSTGVADAEIIKIAVKSLGLDELTPFNPKEKIIEYLLEDTTSNALVDMTLNEFAHETASESPAPGGGSISAYMGAIGVSLGMMVANLSAHKRGWDDRWEEFSDWAEKGKEYQTALLKMVDEDTQAFNKIMDAFGLPKKTDEDKAKRRQAIEDATKYAIEVPFKVMELCLGAMEVMQAMAEIGNPNSVTDAAVGAIAARGGVLGAFLNVKINASGLKDKAYVDTILTKGKAIEDKAIALETKILQVADGKM